MNYWLEEIQTPRCILGLSWAYLGHIYGQCGASLKPSLAHLWAVLGPSILGPSWGHAGHIPASVTTRPNAGWPDLTGPGILATHLRPLKLTDLVAMALVGERLAFQECRGVSSATRLAPFSDFGGFCKPTIHRRLSDELLVCFPHHNHQGREHRQLM